jgi:hypothetical protein
MKEKLLKNLPIFLNGFAVSMLLGSIPKISFLDITMYILAMISFLWHCKEKK